MHSTLKRGWLLPPKFPRAKHTHRHSEGASLASKTRGPGGRGAATFLGPSPQLPRLCGAPDGACGGGRGRGGRPQRHHENSRLRTVANYLPNSRALPVRSTDDTPKTGDPTSESRTPPAPSQNGRNTCAGTDRAEGAQACGRPEAPTRLALDSSQPRLPTDTCCGTQGPGQGVREACTPCNWKNTQRPRTAHVQRETPQCKYRTGQEIASVSTADRDLAASAWRRVNSVS